MEALGRWGLAGVVIIGISSGIALGAGVAVVCRVHELLRGPDPGVSPCLDHGAQCAQPETVTYDGHGAPVVAHPRA